MKNQELLIGYDLCDLYTQISYYNDEKNEPDAMTVRQQNRIPTALCKIFSDGSWYFGKEALEAANAGKGVLIQHFTEHIQDDPVVDVAGERIEKAVLIAKFMQLTLTHIDTIDGQANIAYLTVTMEKMNPAMADALAKAAKCIGVQEGHLSVQGHLLSYEQYALSQRRDLWLHDVGLFAYDQKGLWYHHLSISTKYRPALVTSQSTDLTEYLNGRESENPVGPDMDRRFEEAIIKVTEQKTITTFYLVGDYFEENSDGKNWMNISLQRLCAMHRHVFVGQNLYARGACYQSYTMAHGGRQNNFQAYNEDLTAKEIYIRTIHRHTPQKTLLAPSGMPWYNVPQEQYVLLGDSDELVIHVRDTISNLESTAVLTLNDLPKRPPKTTKLCIKMSFSAQNLCHLTVQDKGFGELFAATDKVWQLDFDLDAPCEASVDVKEGHIIQIAQPEVVVPLDMKMSGTHLYTLEELCWYLSENVYAITMDLFDEKLFYWMNQVTGSHSLALAISNYKAGEKPLREIVRLVLNSVDYLSNAEIAKVYNCLIDMEKQNPIEQARMAADNYCRYGRYMAALQTYQHVVYQMQHDYAAELTKQFKSETWYHMGITFLRLHNLKSAASCLWRAYELQPQSEYMQSYLCILQLSGSHDEILETVRREKVPSELVDSILAKCAQADAVYADSERCLQLKAGLSADDGFAKKYLMHEKKKYELS